MFPFPVEPIRNRYVTLFGGVSGELAGGEVGVREDALRENTRIDPAHDRVLVSSEVDGESHPLFARETYRVVPLGATRPGAAALSPRGEVVFSSEDFGGSRRRLFDRLAPDAPVVLNASLSRSLGPDALMRHFFGSDA